MAKEVSIGSTKHLSPCVALEGNDSLRTIGQPLGGEKEEERELGRDIKRKQLLIKEHTTARVPIYQKTQKKRDILERKKLRERAEESRTTRESQPRKIIQRRERELELKNILGWPQRNPNPAELALLLLA